MKRRLKYKATNSAKQFICLGLFGSIPKGRKKC